MAELDELLAALDAPADTSVVSSVRQPAALRRALAVAVSMGWAGSGNDGINIALRARLEAFGPTRSSGRAWRTPSPPWASERAGWTTVT